MTENTEAVVCTQPRRYRGEMVLEEHNQLPPQQRELSIIKTLWELFVDVMMLIKPSNAPQPPTEQQCTEDGSTQSKQELKITGPAKRKMSNCSLVCDNGESKRSQQDAYIQIPFSVMFRNESISNKNQLISHEDESPSSLVEVQNYNYKLIDGFPSCADIRKRNFYVMSYNPETKNAELLYEIMNESTLKKRCNVSPGFGKNKLEEDYHQGHLAAAANHKWCQEAYHDTYLMSNMIPQLSQLNQGMWKTLEDYCRQLAAKPGCNVHVYTGPLYLRKAGKDEYVRVLDLKKLISNEKAQPTHLFKVIIVEKNGVEKLECYMMPNEKSEYQKKYNEVREFHYSSTNSTTNYDVLDCFEVCIEKIEEWSGLKFKIDKLQHNMIDHIEKITWKGEDGKGESCEAKIEVKVLIYKRYNSNL